MEYIDFKDNINKAYNIKLQDRVLSLKLTEVKKLTPPYPDDYTGPTPDNYRAIPFVLTFCGPRDIVLPTGIYELVDEGSNPLQLALSAFIQNRDGIFYEAIFN
ncbi:MAG: hypothetical protein ABUK01_03905 [Leptospirales bacterium]